MGNTQDLQLWLQKHVSFVYLPAIEFFLSLHVLANPEHHTYRLQWANEMITAMPKKLVHDLPYFRSLSNNFLEVMDFIEPWNESKNTSVEAGLERIESLTPPQFVESMIGPYYHPKQIESWINGHIDDTFEQLKPEHRDLIRRPLAIKRKFLQFCFDYLPFFQKEERRIEPWLIKALHDHQEQFQKEPVSFLSQIHPRLHVFDDFLQFHKAKTYHFFYRDLQQIYLYPSTFVAPHLLLGVFPERISVALSVEVPGSARATAIPNDFINKMKVFSDPTRAAILKSLLQHPYCIQQLAVLHGISEPAVTKHIKLLTDANFIWGERKGRYVFYRGMPSKIDQLSVDIHEFIDMEDPAIPERRN